MMTMMGLCALAVRKIFSPPRHPCEGGLEQVLLGSIQLLIAVPEVIGR